MTTMDSRKNSSFNTSDQLDNAKLSALSPDGSLIFNAMDFRSKLLELARKMHFQLYTYTIEAADAMQPLLETGANFHDTFNYVLQIHPIYDELYCSVVKTDIMRSVVAGYNMKSDIDEFNSADIGKYMYTCKNCKQSFRPLSSRLQLPDSISCPLCRKVLFNRHLRDELRREYDETIKKLYNQPLSKTAYRLALKCLSLAQRMSAAESDGCWPTDGQEFSIIIDIAPKVFDHDTIELMRQILNTVYTPRIRPDKAEWHFALCSQLEPLYQSLSTIQEIGQDELIRQLQDTVPGIDAKLLIEIWESFGMIARIARGRKEIYIHRIYRQQ